MNMEEIYAIVSGRVQLVMYRDFAQRKAARLGIKGTVRNLPNGTVEVIAQGSREALEKYIKRLHQGSILSRVDAVEVVWRQPSANFTSFDIVFS